MTFTFSRPFFRLFSVLMLGLVISGCSGGTGDAPPPQESEIAAQARSSVQNFLDIARTTPKRAAEEATILLESLEAMANEHGEPYVAILEQARAVEAKYKASAPKAEIDAELKKLETLISSLPS